jgi:hypothetical protein
VRGKGGELRTGNSLDAHELAHQPEVRRQTTTLQRL